LINDFGSGAEEMMGIDIFLRECGLRDGLQNVSQFMPTEDKVAWLRAEAATGMPGIEACSFVPPKLVPQFRDATEVMAEAAKIPNLTISALVPNLKGAERAIAAGVNQINFVMSVSASHNQANVRRSREDSVADFAVIADLIKGMDPAKRPVLSGGLATSFGCTIEGQIPERDVVEFAVKLAEAGAGRIGVADTVGYGQPAAVRRVYKAVLAAVRPLTVSAHFHDTRGLGLANVVASLDAGITNFDACLAGLGGCPYAPGATGNVVMEDLVFMLEGMGLRTGVDLEKLIEVRSILERSLPGVPLQGAIAKAKLPKGFEAKRSAPARLAS
jgi:hydroxymethylglutaryl-CoA lyase